VRANATSRPSIASLRTFFCFVALRHAILSCSYTTNWTAGLATRINAGTKPVQRPNTPCSFTNSNVDAMTPDLMVGRGGGQLSYRQLRVAAASAYLFLSVCIRVVTVHSGCVIEALMAPAAVAINSVMGVESSRSGFPRSSRPVAHVPSRQRSIAHCHLHRAARLCHQQQRRRARGPRIP